MSNRPRRAAAAAASAYIASALDEDALESSDESSESMSLILTHDRHFLAIPKRSGVHFFPISQFYRLQESGEESLPY